MRNIKFSPDAVLQFASYSLMGAGITLIAVAIVLSLKKEPMTVITSAFVIRLAKMPEKERNQFLHSNRSEINFHNLSTRLKQMGDEAIEKAETDLAEKFFNIRADIYLYEAYQRFPGAMTDVELITNPTQDNEAEKDMKLHAVEQ